MGTGKLPSKVYQDPWSTSLESRLSTLATGRVRIAYFYEQPNNSTFRYRAYNMAQVLNEDIDETSASYFFLDDLHELENLVDIADIIIICRSRYCHRIANLIQRFKARGKPVLFDIDDLVFNSRYCHLIIQTLSQTKDDVVWDYWFSYTSRIAETMRLCDKVITTNEFLAKKVAEEFSIPTAVVQNFINKEQLEISNTTFFEKKSFSFKKNEKIRFGYFSGSPSHKNDFSITLSALESVLESDPAIELTLAGYVDVEKPLKKFGSQVKYESFRDYVSLQRLIGSVDFNLMPLQYNAFTNCKSPLKFFEAAAVGTLSIASPAINYADVIEHGVSGYLARDYEWETVIQQALDDDESYSGRVITARNIALARFTYRNQREAILNALDLT
ncbi:MAG: glycosyltransferase family 4 protein [Halioglobus sp.]|nr:glycosyltransferase family 4 protein [Halioglobus sp.]